MKLTTLDIVDWEPCTLRFVFSEKPSDTEEIQRFFEGWLKQSSRGTGCACRYRYVEFLTEANIVVLKAEWLCRLCARALADATKQQYHQLIRVELGIRGSRELPVEAQFIQIPAKTIEYEDGRKLPVNSFKIGRRPVTVGDFRRFVDETGYRTLAEQQDCAETFENHFGLSGLPSHVRNEVPVQFVTFLDAEEFARYTSCRLPTEAEWLAAAIRDTKEISISPGEELRLRTKPLPPDAMEVTCWDITASRSEGLIVARRGPHLFLKTGWREKLAMDFHRWLIDEWHYDMSLTFRLVSDK